MNAFRLTAIAMSILLHAGVLLAMKSNFIRTEAPLEAAKSNQTYINFSVDMNYEGSRSPARQADRGRTEVRPQEGDLSAEKAKAMPSKNTRHAGSTARSVSEEQIRILNNYYSKVLKRIHRMKYYPASSRKNREQGTVALRFVLNRNGELKGNVVLLRECSYRALNTAGIETILKASPFPSLPEDLGKDELVLSVEVDFVI